VDQKRSLFVSLAVAIVGFGIVMVYSASITSWPTEFERIYLSRQLEALAVGLVLAAACACAPVKFWKTASPFLLAVTIVLLAAVLIPSLGTRVNGARRWLRHGGFQFQPSELAKLVLTLYLCGQAERLRVQGLRRKVNGSERTKWSSLSDLGSQALNLAPVILPIAPTAGLVMAEPDLGTAMFLVACSAIALFVAGCPLRLFAAAGALAVPAVGLVAVLRPYQMRRVTGFLATWSDWSQVPYQLDQSLVSMGAGGLFGVGLGKGWQKLSFLPEANTDFVFSVVGEELGLVGTFGLLALWGALYWAGLQMLRSIRQDRFASTAGFTLLTQMVLQALINMAVVTALVPPKGIPLPLVSYGGSSLVMNLASLGIILSLSRAETAALSAREVESGRESRRRQLCRLEPS
jgi:cell division protein FtsW